MNLSHTRSSWSWRAAGERIVSPEQLRTHSRPGDRPWASGGVLGASGGGPACPDGWAAIGVGFLGVLVIVKPGTTAFQLASLLPVAAATLYAVMHILARKIGGTIDDTEYPGAVIDCFCGDNLQDVFKSKASFFAAFGASAQ